MTNQNGENLSKNFDVYINFLLKIIEVILNNFASYF